MAQSNMRPLTMDRKTDDSEKSPDLSRRALLRTAALPAAAVALAAIPAIAQSTSAEDPVIPLWRAWWQADNAADIANAAWSMAFHALPVELQSARVEFGGGHCHSVECIERKATRLKENAYGWVPTGLAENGGMRGKIVASPKMLQRVEERRQAALMAFEEAERQAQAAQDAAGVTALEAEGEAADERASVAYNRLRAATAISKGPATALASLHMAAVYGKPVKDHPDDDPWCSIAAAVAALSHGMPADLIEALHAELRKHEWSSPKGGEA